MEDNNKNENKTPNPLKEPLSKDKRKLVLAIGILLFILIYGAQFIAMFEKKMSYNEFMYELDAGQVESASINKTTGKVSFYLKDDYTKYKTNYPYTEDFIEMLLVNDVEMQIKETSWFSYVLQYGTMPILFIVFLFAMTNMNKVGESGFGVEPVENIKTRFSDVAGMSELKEDLLLLSDMMKNEEYRKSGARIPRGVLLQGPPGNGKTLLARAFAGETGVNFIAVNACDFGSQFVGIGSSKIKKVFQEAKKNAPCVIFIDEIDSVGAKRGSASDAAGKEMNTMLTALLNQMDGFKQMDNIIVLAATNRASDLDDALIRPGRFDRQLVVNHPDKITRIEILKLYTKGKNIASDVDFDKLASKTFGYSCSKIECIVNEAVILSIKEKNNSVTMQNFEDAILHMDIKGHVKKNFTQTEEERKTVAYHEAGHAVATYFATNKEVSSITIRPTTSGAGGFTITEAKEETSLCPIADYKNELIMLYGGRAAEVVLRGSVEAATAGASADIRQATKIATSYVSIEKGIDFSLFGETGIEKVMSLTEELLSNVWEQSLSVIKEHWIYVEAVSSELLKTETVSKERFIEIINEVNNAQTTNVLMDDMEEM